MNVKMRATVWLTLVSGAGLVMRSSDVLVLAGRIGAGPGTGLLVCYHHFLGILDCLGKKKLETSI